MSVSHVSADAIQIAPTAKDNTLRNVVAYRNAQNGIKIDGANTTFSHVQSYGNSGAGITGSGNSNYYYDTLRIFGNGTDNSAGPVIQGSASHWLSGFANGSFNTSGSFSAAWAVNPSNVSGFNVNAM